MLRFQAVLPDSEKGCLTDFHELGFDILSLDEQIRQLDADRDSCWSSDPVQSWVNLRSLLAGIQAI